MVMLVALLPVEHAVVLDVMPDLVGQHHVVLQV